MGNIYIEVDENFRVTKIHRMPFDPNNGMGYTREELEKKGFFVDEIPEPIHQVGRRSIAMYNPDTKSIYYEYVGIPMSDKERLGQLEKAMNFIARNALYGYAPYQTIAMTVTEEDTNKVDSGIEAIGEYIAYQVISGKMDVGDAIKNFPQCESVIKDVLRQNGIQV